MAEMQCLTGTSILVLRDSAVRLGGKPLACNCLWSLESDFFLYQFGVGQWVDFFDRNVQMLTESRGSCL